MGVPGEQETTPSDLELVECINSGDAPAFETLYHRYRDWVHRVAWRLTGHEEDALDVLQETFSWLLSKFPGFELRARMTSVLYPAIRNLAIGVARKRRRSLAPPTDLALVEATDDRGADGPDVLLRAALGRLSGEQRELLQLRFVDGLAVAAIAEALEIPAGTVKSRLHKALGLLRDDPHLAEFFRGKHDSA